MMIRSFFSILLIVFGLGHALQLQAQDAADAAPIVVRLSTDKQLMPLYLLKIADDNAGLEASYLEQLESVLRFDLDHNGMTQAVARTKQRETLAGASGIDDLGKGDDWKAQNIYYVVRAVVRDKKISVRMLSVNGNTMKSTGWLPLVGGIGTYKADATIAARWTATTQIEM